MGLCFNTWNIIIIMEHVYVSKVGYNVGDIRVERSESEKCGGGEFSDHFPFTQDLLHDFNLP